MYNEILYKKLLDLKNEYHILAIKSEFEAEGSSFRDVCRLRILTNRLGIKLYLKIGGYEAVRDLIDSLELDVDGIVVPMVENEFSIRKFLQSYMNIYNGEERFLTINIESKNAVNNIGEIVDICSSSPFNNVTIGRTDLSQSYNQGYSVEDRFITKTILSIAKKFKEIGFKVTVGGSVSYKTLETVSKNPELLDLVDRIETRKVVFDIEDLSMDLLRNIFDFERFYILYKKEINDIVIESELNRLNDLERRLK